MLLLNHLLVGGAVSECSEYTVQIKALMLWFGGVPTSITSVLVEAKGLPLLAMTTTVSLDLCLLSSVTHTCSLMIPTVLSYSGIISLYVL